jgi:peptidoglycan/xylan/chitin deacetylase (PgdA/CDA1 family)
MNTRNPGANMSTKSALAALASCFGACVRQPWAFPIAAPVYRSSINIAYYHGVWPDGSEQLRLFGGLSISQFTASLRGLAENFRFVDLDEAISAPVAADGQPTLAITFDDGLEMISSKVIGLLAELGISATMYIVASCIGNRHLMWRHKLSCIQQMRGTGCYMRAFRDLQAANNEPLPGPTVSMDSLLRRWPTALKDEYADQLWRACDMPPLAEVLDRYRPYYDWHGLADWLEAGHSVGLHTATHPYCSRLGRDEIEPEFIAPQALLYEKLNLRRLSFAYPFGDRLRPDIEREVFVRCGFSSMLGTKGLSPRGATAERLERMKAEFDADLGVYGKPLLMRAFGRGS